MMKYLVLKGNILLFFLLTFAACKEEDPPNPFSNVENPNGPTVEEIILEPTSIEGLHANMFKKTCANSGCHDGTFEPDYRTIESTYNTLVYQPVIKNDPQATFTYRVLPGNVNASQLIARLTYDIDGTSGIMPLVIEPDSDWNTEKETLLQNVKDWIQGGAKDIMGNQPLLNDNGRPWMLGIAGFTDAWAGREDGGLGALRIPKTQTTLDIYFALTDDKTLPAQLKNNKVKFAAGIDDFAAAPELNLEILSTPVERPGYEGENVKYYHKISIDPSQYATLDEQIYFRVYVQDDANPITEIPAEGGAVYIKEYSSFIIIE